MSPSPQFSWKARVSVVSGLKLAVNFFAPEKSFSNTCYSNGPVTLTTALHIDSLRHWGSGDSSAGPKSVERDSHWGSDQPKGGRRRRIMMMI